MVQGLVSLFFADGIFEPLNLGNPSPITMLDLAKEIVSFTKSKSAIVYRPLPEDDPLTREPDGRRAKELLNWEPRISRRIGLQKTIEYFEREIRS